MTDQHRELSGMFDSYLRACNRHDLDVMATFYSPSITVNDVPMNPAAVSTQFVPIFSAFPDWRWAVRHLAIDGPLISLHFIVTGTHQGTFRGFAPTGRRVAFSEFTMYRVADGKFGNVWDLADMAAVDWQLGHGHDATLMTAFLEPHDHGRGQTNLPYSSSPTTLRSNQVLRPTVIHQQAQAQVPRTNAASR